MKPFQLFKEKKDDELEAGSNTNLGSVLAASMSNGWRASNKKISIQLETTTETSYGVPTTISLYTLGELFQAAW